MSFDMYKRYLTEPMTLVEGGLVKPIWHPDGKKFCFAEGDVRNLLFFSVNPETVTKELFLEVSETRKHIAACLRHEPPFVGIPFDQFVFLDENSIAFKIDEKTFRMELGSYDVSMLSDEAALSDLEKSRYQAKKNKAFFGGWAEEVYSPDGKYLAGVKDFNIYLRYLIDGRKQFLTQDGTEDTPWVDLSLQWSPGGKYILARHFETQGVHKVPIVHWLKKNEEVEWVYFPRAGEITFKQTMVLLDPVSGERIPLNIPGGSYEYINPAGWLPDEKRILYSTMDRGFKQLDLWLKDLQSGEVQHLLRESDEKFLEYDPFGSAAFQLVRDGEQFLWFSDRDGWRHLYLYTIEGKLVNQVTSGEYSVASISAVDEAKDTVFFMANAEERVYDEHLYSSKLDGSNFKRVSKGEGTHFPQFSPSMEYVIDTYATVARAPVTVLRTTGGKALLELSRMDISKLRSDLGWVEPEEFMVKAADGVTDLYGAIYKPLDFDPQKKYPVIEYIYNGPHACSLPTAMLPALMKAYGLRMATGYNGDIHEALAQLGYIVVFLEGRGTTRRGKQFQQSSYGNLGFVEIQDHVAALRQLADENEYIDLDRVGITGYSYGGFLTLYAMLTEPDVYKVGVAAAPIPDMFNAGYSYPEHYMGLPQENPEGYRNASCIEKAGNLKGKLLIVAGMSDTNAFFSGAVQMAEAFTRVGKPYDLIILPEQTHLYEGKSAEYYLEQTGQYFLKNL